MTTNLTCADLFAGMGGTALGAIQAGFDVLVSANHWPVAVATHKLNHPETEHYMQDVQQANFFDWPDFDMLLASPACQGHSRARGKDRPHHDATRSTAWALVAAVEAKRPMFVVTKHVPDFVRWQLYPQCKSRRHALGYTLCENLLNAADLGVPQHRRRLFVRRNAPPIPPNSSLPSADGLPAAAVRVQELGDGSHFTASVTGVVFSVVTELRYRFLAWLRSHGQAELERRWRTRMARQWPRRCWGRTLPCRRSRRAAR